MTKQGPQTSDCRIESLDDQRQRASSRSNCYGLLALIYRDAPTVQVVAEFITEFLYCHSS